MKWIAAAGIGVLAFLVLVWGSWELADSRSFQLFGELVNRVETDQPKVALTFDDGPTVDGTQAILPLLASENVHATFFFTGAELEPILGWPVPKRRASRPDTR